MKKTYKRRLNRKPRKSPKLAKSKRGTKHRFKRGGVRTVKSSLSGRTFTIRTPPSVQEESQRVRQKLRKRATLDLIVELETLFKNLHFPGDSIDNPDFVRRLGQIDSALKRATASKLFTRNFLEAGRAALRAETRGIGDLRLPARAREAPARLQRAPFGNRKPTKAPERTALES